MLRAGSLLAIIGVMSGFLCSRRRVSACLAFFFCDMTMPPGGCALPRGGGCYRLGLSFPNRSDGFKDLASLIDERNCDITLAILRRVCRSILDSKRDTLLQLMIVVMGIFYGGLAQVSAGSWSGRRTTRSGCPRSYLWRFSGSASSPFWCSRNVPNAKEFLSHSIQCA